jgi:hypothetical protein
VVSYESTVDRDHLHDRRTRSHLIHAAAEATGLPFGVPAGDVALRIGATASELAVKRAAIGVHASQVSPDSLGHAGFDEAYGYEWYLRSGGAGILDELAAPAAVPAPA